MYINEDKMKQMYTVGKDAKTYKYCKFEVDLVNTLIYKRKLHNIKCAFIRNRETTADFCELLGLFIIFT